METKTGVYQIYFTGDITLRYIGSSRDIKQRWRPHKSGLKKGNHGNKPLQEAYNKYGIDNLKFFVIEYLHDDTPQDVLFSVEQYWIDTVGFDNLYNVYPKAGSPEGAIVTEDTKQKKSEAMKGKQLTDEHRQKISVANRGKKFTEEHKQKKSEASIRFYQENPDFQKGENHYNYGKPSKKRNQEVWYNYHLIKDLHILNPELGYKSLCTLFNKTFSTNYPSYSFNNILPKIKEELVQRNS